MKSVDIEGLLHNLGLHHVVRRNTNIMACCPNHEESRPSWGVNINAPHMHGCFACGYAGTLASMLQFKFRWSKEKIINLLGKDAFGELGKTRDMTFRSADEMDQIFIPFVDESELFPFELEKKGRLYLLKRGITKKTMKRAGLLYHYKDNRILFPWWWNGKLAGMTGRACYDVDEDDKKIIGYCDIKKSRLLYVPYNKGRLNPDKPVIVVEGEIDSLKVLQSGFKNVCALGHGRVSKQPVRLLKTLPVKSLVIFTDNDRRGRELSDELAEAFQGFCPVSEVIWKGVKKKDPGEMDEDQIRCMIRNTQRKIKWPNFG
jgi:DNA primase